MKIIYATVFAALLLSGCGRKPAPQLTLLSAPHSPDIIDLDPRMQELAIDANGGLWFQSRQVSAEELRDRIQSRLKELRNPPVAIRADADLSVRTVRKTIDILDSLGVQRQTFMVLREPPDLDSAIDFVTTDPKVQDFVVVEMKGENMTLNGRAVDSDKLRRVLARLAAFSITIPVVVVPDSETVLQRCVDALDLCYSVGLHNLHLLQESPITELEEDTQQDESTVPVKAAPSASSDD